MQLCKLALVILSGSVFDTCSATSSARNSSTETSAMSKAVFNHSAADVRSDNASRQAGEAQRPGFDESDCPWLDHTKGSECLDTAGGPAQTAACAHVVEGADALQYMDGSFCRGLRCCAQRGGRARCPASMPLMCQEASCGNGTEHCCQVSCAGHGGVRRCPRPAGEAAADAVAEEIATFLAEAAGAEAGARRRAPREAGDVLARRRRSPGEQPLLAQRPREVRREAAAAPRHSGLVLDQRQRDDDGKSRALAHVDNKRPEHFPLVQGGLDATTIFFRNMIFIVAGSMVVVAACSLFGQFSDEEK